MGASQLVEPAWEQRANYGGLHGLHGLQGHPPGTEPPDPVRVTVEGRLLRRSIAGAIVLVLAVAAFVGGRAVADRLESAAPVELAAPDPGPRSSASPPADPSPAGEPVSPGDRAAPTGAGVAPVPVDQAVADPAAPPGQPEDEGPADAVQRLESLRLVPFDEPVVLVDAATAPDLNNTVGVDTSSLGGLATPAVVADLIVTGPAGATVSVHPGDRPSDAMRFTIPASGRLLVPHLIAATDDAGRIVVAATEEARVRLDGHGRYVRADRARGGRFVPTGSMRLGSLVTATDGRRLVLQLSDHLGDEAADVARAVVRVNANVAPGGGSIAVGSGPPIPWPGPAEPDLGMAGTELLTVTPDDGGEIVMDYLGGSVLTVDLVGYYTGDEAPESAAGLLVLAPAPSLQEIEAGGGAGVVDLGPEATGGPGSIVAVTIEAANGDLGGSLTVWTKGEPEPATPAFALAAGQRRTTTEWIHPAPGSSAAAFAVRAPDGASLRIWTIGHYT